MPINDFRKINIGSVLNEVARVKILTNGIGSVQFYYWYYIVLVLVLYSFLSVRTKIVVTLGSTGPIEKVKWGHEGEKRVTIFKTVINSMFNSLI